MEPKNQNKEDLQEDLLKFATNNDISYTFFISDPYMPAMSLKQKRHIYINENWHNPDEIPFIIGHEIGHIMLGEQGIIYLKSFVGQCSEEKTADLYSLKLIFDYSKKHGDYFSDPGIFMKSYGIPWRMAHATKVLFKQDHDLFY